MSQQDEPTYRRMQVKVLYSFNNNGTVFLSRSRSQYSVKIAQIPMALSSNPLQSQEQEFLTLGAFDLKTCTQQILKNSPENFHLNMEDYAVYYKDITEQPDEPFVSQGEMSSLLNSSKSHLIPGRVCQNLSASYLFGDKSNSSSLTLEIRLKLHTIERSQQNHDQDSAPAVSSNTNQSKNSRRPNNESIVANNYSAQKRQRHSNKPTNSSVIPSSSASVSASASASAIKATRTKSLPIFYHPHSQQVFNIINADKLNAPSKYDSKSVQDRFKSAPFLQAKIIDNPSTNRIRQKNYNSNTKVASRNTTPTINESTTPIDLPQRAVRTRSMASTQPMISSPINEEVLFDVSDGSDDTEYNENSNEVMNKENNNNEHSLDEDDEDDDDYDEDQTESSPYTPQQPPYKPKSAPVISSGNHQFHSLPDLEDLDSKKTHTIPDTKLPKDHGLVCTNSNCATTSSMTWRYFETKFHPNYLAIHRAKEFNKKNYEGMFGPLCNACYLFLRNKGFMRPEGVVKKYLQQQKYKKDLKQKDSSLPLPAPASAKSLTHPSNMSSSSPLNPPTVPSTNKFLTPSHTPSAINQVIQNNNNNNNNLHKTNFNDLTDFMNQLNSFGGPLTDIDPLPQDSNQQQGITPPMMATKSNTRVINIYEDYEGEDKENWPPVGEDDNEDQNDFDKMIAKSFTSNNTPDHNEWSTLFGGPTPKDQTTPKNNQDDKNQLQNAQQQKTTNSSNLPQLRTFKSSPLKLDKAASVANMPSSPLLSSNIENIEDEVNNLVSNEMFNDSSSPATHASRLDTVMSYNHNLGKQSSPSSDFYSNDEKLNH